MTAPRTRPVDAAALQAVPRRATERLDPERMVVAVVRAYLEVEAGRRPLEQLERALSPAVRDRLRSTLARRRRDALATGGPRPSGGPDIRSVRALQISQPSPDALEAAVTVRTGARTTAVCIRLERWRGGWRVTELARPEDGLTPLPSRAVFRRPEPDAFDEAAAEATP